MADNFLYIPFINPVKFFDTTRANLAKYFTKHFDEWLFMERLNYWQQRESFHRPWQVEDIINLQFESTFDPIIVELLDKYGIPRITLPALTGMPNQYIPGTYSFEVEMSLAGLPTGCYVMRITAGSGVGQKILRSDVLFVSATPLKYSLCLEYWNSRYHEDVLFETGIKFQYRTWGNIGFLEPTRRDELYRDQRNNPALLNSKTGRQFPVFFGDHRGCTDDEIDLLNRIWSCDNVLIDNKAYCIADGSKFEFIVVDKYPKRGVKLTVEEGINRNSRIFAVNTDTTKKIMANIFVDGQVFGDLSNQGSSNAVPVLNILSE